MSSFVRRLQRAVKRQKNYMGRASQLGVTNPKATDLLARKAREDARIVSRQGQPTG